MVFVPEMPDTVSPVHCVR